MAQVKLVHFSDVLCIWAHVGQSHLAKLSQEFGQDVDVEMRFCSVFPDVRTKIAKSWGARGGFAGYAAHVKTVADRFDTPLHADTWAKVQPHSSASPHLLIKAIQLLEPTTARPFSDRPSTKAAAALRHAFFAEGQDIANWKVQRSVADKIGLDFDAALQKIETGEAIAALAGDYDLAQSTGIQGSPTFVLNEGRQKLFGDISYSILAANIHELQGHSRDEEASFCA